MTRIVSTLLLLFVSLLAPASEYTFSPKEIPALKQLLGSGNLQPGDVVTLRDGIYNDLEETDFTGKGSFGTPIAWRAENPGKAIISGKRKGYMPLIAV